MLTSGFPNVAPSGFFRLDSLPLTPVSSLCAEHGARESLGPGVEAVRCGQPRLRGRYAGREDRGTPTRRLAFPGCAAGSRWLPRYGIAMSDQRATVHAHAARQLGAVREQPFGPDADVYKVGGKMFAIVSCGDAPGRLTVKVDPAIGEALRAEHAAITPGYHTNKRHWVTVELDGSVPDALVCELVEDSHGLVRPRRASASD